MLLCRWSDYGAAACLDAVLCMIDDKGGMKAYTGGAGIDDCVTAQPSQNAAFQTAGNVFGIGWRLGQECSQAARHFEGFTVAKYARRLLSEIFLSRSGRARRWPRQRCIQWCIGYVSRHRCRFKGVFSACIWLGEVDLSLSQVRKIYSVVKIIATMHEESRPLPLGPLVYRSPLPPRSPVISCEEWAQATSFLEQER